MWIALGIVLSVLLLFSILLFSPVHIILKTDENDGFKIRIRFLFVFLDPVNLGMKFQNKGSKKSGKIKNWFKKHFGVFHKKQKKPIEKKSLFDKVSETLSAVRIIIDALSEIVKKIKVNKLKLYIVTADSNVSDAALEYGKLCAVVYPVIGYLQSQVNIREKGLDIDLRCDFDADISVFKAHTDISINIFSILTVFMRSAFSKDKGVK